MVSRAIRLGTYKGMSMAAVLGFDEFLPISLPVLDGKNFNQWVAKMKVIFGFQDVLEVVVDGVQDEADSAACERDSRAFFIIHQCVDFAHLEKISIAKSAKEAWKILHKAYQGVDKVKKRECMMAKTKTNNNNNSSSNSNYNPVSRKIEDFSKSRERNEQQHQEGTCESPKDEKDRGLCADEVSFLVRVLGSGCKEDNQQHRTLENESSNEKSTTPITRDLPGGSSSTNHSLVVSSSDSSGSSSTEEEGTKLSGLKVAKIPSEGLDLVAVKELPAARPQTTFVGKVIGGLQSWYDVGTVGFRGGSRAMLERTEESPVGISHMVVVTHLSSDERSKCSAVSVLVDCCDVGLMNSGEGTPVRGGAVGRSGQICGGKETLLVQWFTVKKETKLFLLSFIVGKKVIQTGAELEFLKVGQGVDLVGQAQFYEEDEWCIRKIKSKWALLKCGISPGLDLMDPVQFFEQLQWDPGGYCVLLYF